MLIKAYKGHRCALDFDRGFVNLQLIEPVVKDEEWCWNEVECFYEGRGNRGEATPGGGGGLGGHVPTGNEKKMKLASAIYYRECQTTTLLLPYSRREVLVESYLELSTW